MVELEARTFAAALAARSAIGAAGGVALPDSTAHSSRNVKAPRRRGDFRRTSALIKAARREYWLASRRRLARGLIS
jgi:hypothetical protein